MDVFVQFFNKREESDLASCAGCIKIDKFGFILNKKYGKVCILH